MVTEWLKAISAVTDFAKDLSARMFGDQTFAERKADTRVTDLEEKYYAALKAGDLDGANRTRDQLVQLRDHVAASTR